MAPYDIAIIGGGIIGLSVAVHVIRLQPHARILLVEKERAPALHQTSRNPGLIHSGIHHEPGSAGARLGRSSARTLVRFCEEHGVPHTVCGKLIVASQLNELPRLEALYRRARQNGIPVERVAHERAREIEPNVEALAALWIKTTAVTSYSRIARALLLQFRTAGGTAKFDSEFFDQVTRGSVHVLRTSSGDYETRFLINCAGLHSDRVAAGCGADLDAAIVPVRCQYVQLVPERRHLVNAVVQTVSPAGPLFPGVGFARGIDGVVRAGAMTMPAAGREAYHWRQTSPREVLRLLGGGSWWKAAARNPAGTIGETWRGLSRASMARRLQRIIPEIRAQDLLPCDGGIRAQLIHRDGRLVEGPLIVTRREAIHVCHAGPAGATVALDVAREVAGRVPTRQAARSVTVLRS